MGWADCGTDDRGRPIGYAHAGFCDEPACEATIDRGLAYVCGGMHGGGARGCGGYFCAAHLYHASPRGGPPVGVCAECLAKVDEEDD